MCVSERERVEGWCVCVSERERERVEGWFLLLSVWFH